MWLIRQICFADFFRQICFASFAYSHHIHLSLCVAFCVNVCSHVAKILKIHLYGTEYF